MRDLSLEGHGARFMIVFMANSIAKFRKISILQLFVFKQKKFEKG